MSRWFLSISQDEDSSPLWQPVPVLGHSQKKKVFSDVQRVPSVFQSVPIASGSLTEHHWKESGHVFLAPSLQISTYIDEVPQTQLSQTFLIGEMLQSLHHLQGPLLDFL